MNNATSVLKDKEFKKFSHSLEKIVDELSVKRGIKLKFNDNIYSISYQPYDDLGLSYYCPRLGDNVYNIIIDKNLSEQERRIVLFHEILELFLYHKKGIRPIETCHEVASKQHLKYAKKRSIAAPPQ